MTGYSIENPPTSANAGDTLLVHVEQTMSDGTVTTLPSTTTVTWNVPTVTPLMPDSTADSPLPANSAAPNVFFVANTARTDAASAIANRLFVHRCEPGRLVHHRT